jgi:hypothetical protein
VFWLRVFLYILRFEVVDVICRHESETTGPNWSSMSLCFVSSSLSFFSSLFWLRDASSSCFTC